MGDGETTGRVPAPEQGPVAPAGEAEPGPEDPAQPPAPDPGESAQVGIEEQLAEARERAAALQAEADELRARLLRLQADFDNYRRRTRQERERMQEIAGEEILRDLLPVADDLERALAAAEAAARNAEDPLLQGVRMVLGSLLDLLERHGVRPLPGVGHPFDPEVHEAAGPGAEGEGDVDLVVEELRKGYRLGSKVLRPSVVRVGRAVASEGETA